VLRTWRVNRKPSISRSASTSMGARIEGAGETETVFKASHPWKGAKHGRRRKHRSGTRHCAAGRRLTCCCRARLEHLGAVLKFLRGPGRECGSGGPGLRISRANGTHRASGLRNRASLRIFRPTEAPSHGVMDYRDGESQNSRKPFENRFMHGPRNFSAGRPDLRSRKRRNRHRRSEIFGAPVMAKICARR